MLDRILDATDCWNKYFNQLQSRDAIAEESLQILNDACVEANIEIIKDPTLHGKDCIKTIHSKQNIEFEMPQPQITTEKTKLSDDTKVSLSKDDSSQIIHPNMVVIEDIENDSGNEMEQNYEVQQCVRTHDKSHSQQNDESDVLTEFPESDLTCDLIDKSSKPEPQSRKRSHLEIQQNTLEKELQQQIEVSFIFF